MFVLGFVNRKIFLSFKKEIIIKGSLKYYFADEQPLIWYSKNQNAPQQINKTFHEENLQVFGAFSLLL